MSKEKQIVIVDSSQLDTFNTCPMQWNLSYRENLQLKTIEENRPLIMGTYGHKLLEIYYKAIACGNNSQNALQAALTFPIDDEEKQFPLEATDRALVREKVELYSYTYSRNDLKPANCQSIEIGFSQNIYEDDSYLFVLEGRIDILGTLGGLPLFSDHKFQMKQKMLYPKSIQFRNYALVTQQTTGLINYIRFTKKTDNTTYQRVPISFSKAELHWWRGRLIDLFYQVADAQRTGLYEQRFSQCSGKYSECPFTGLCEEIVPAVATAKKNQFYTIKKEWKPW